MKKKILLFIVLTGMLNIANAQWQQTSLDSINIYTLAANGNNLYAGSDSGGVYVSTNSGTSWTLVNSGIPKSSVFSIAISGNYMFAGTADSGVYLSINNGLNWTAVNNGLPYNFINILAIVDTTIYAGILDTGVYYKSINNNSNWIATSLNNDYISSITGNGTNIFAGGFNDNVYKSFDSGLSWINTYNGIPEYGPDAINSIAMVGTNIFAGGYYVGVYKSNIYDTNWVGVNTGIVDKMIHSLAVNGTNIIAGANNGYIYYTMNNGASWSLENVGFPTIDVISLLVNGGNVYAGTGGYGVWKRSLSELGIKENTLNNISIYPNPAKDNLTIETNTTNTEQRIEIINIVGQTVYTNIINKKVTVNTSAFPSGVYILKLSTDKETVVKKFVKE